MTTPFKRSTFNGPEQDFFMPEDGSTGRREQYGVKKRLRMWRNGEAYGYVDPDELASLSEPPTHAQAALEDTLGDWAKDENGEERIKLRVHPHMRRWCLYEREYRPEIGQNVWRCFYIFQTDPVAGKLPSDMDGDLYYAHFRGRVGEYVEPDRSHFEMLERFNIHKYGATAVAEHSGQLEDKEEAEIDAREEERTQAFIDDNWALARDEANQAYGSGSFMCDAHCRNWNYKTNLARYKREQKNGYCVVTKKSREEYAAELVDELSRFKQAWGDAVGLKQAYIPTDDEWDEILKKAGLKPPMHTVTQEVIDDKKALVEKRKRYRDMLVAKLNADIVEEFINRAPDDTERKERTEALRQIAAVSKISE